MRGRLACAQDNGRLTSGRVGTPRRTALTSLASHRPLSRPTTSPQTNWPPTDGASRGLVRSYVALTSKFRRAGQPVQQTSTATSPPSTDLIRPEQTRELHQRPASTSLPLVHSEAVTRAAGPTNVGSGFYRGRGGSSRSRSRARAGGSSSRERRGPGRIASS
jgi:hypothetical protein